MLYLIEDALVSVEDSIFEVGQALRQLCDQVQVVEPVGVITTVAFPVGVLKFMIWSVNWLVADIWSCHVAVVGIGCSFVDGVGLRFVVCIAVRSRRHLAQVMEKVLIIVAHQFFEFFNLFRSLLGDDVGSFGLQVFVDLLD